MDGLCWRTREEGFNSWDVGVVRYSTSVGMEGGVTPFTTLRIHSTIDLKLSGETGPSARHTVSFSLTG